ncbi:MAG: YjjG family noncanonical pyrimidine nucleotidase [Bacteroides sp.]|nr:YjjG family noncanonical pyrimidine nucleotidase [Bacteroides sp.]
MKYKNIFFDLDDTLWAFSENARDTFVEMYEKYNLDYYFDSFEHFYTIYQKKNAELWGGEYGKGHITKNELNESRFFFPLQSVGCHDKELTRKYSKDFLQTIPTKTKLMPHAKEILDYLSHKYQLYILSNGFKELQNKKMRSAGIQDYFRQVVLSEDIGIMKPYPEIFHFALSATHSDQRESIMIGDSWDADIIGSHNLGMHQIYYNISNRKKLPFTPTFIISSLKELESIL